jgi:hypothetical protein
LDLMRSIPWRGRGTTIETNVNIFNLESVACH